MRMLLRGLIFLLAMAMAMASSAFAADVTLQWDANSEDDLGGYRCYRAITPGGHTFGIGNEAASILAGTEIVTVTVEDGTHYFVVTAWDGDGNESEPSNEVKERIDTTPPDPPQNCFTSAIVK